MGGAPLIFPEFDIAGRNTDPVDGGIDRYPLAQIDLIPGMVPEARAVKDQSGYLADRDSRGPA